MTAAQAAPATPADTEPCGDCHGWGTIVEGAFDSNQAHGGTEPLTEYPCPRCRPDEAGGTS